jgi:hypothetical protein
MFEGYSKENEKRHNLNGTSPAAVTQSFLMESGEKDIIV